MRNWLHEPFEWSPTPKLGGGWIAHKSSPSAPPTPDFAGLAQQQINAGRVNQLTPYGSSTWQTDPNSPGGATQTINLSPDQQALLNMQSKNALALNPAIQSATANLHTNPIDNSSMQSVADQAYKNYTARLDPQWAQASQQEQTRLANQGVVPGTAAYDNAMRVFNQGKNDAYTTANTAAINTMPQTLALNQSIYNQPLNYLNSLRSGAIQPTTPIFPSASPAGNLQSAGQQAAAFNQGLYGLGVGQANSFNSGLMGLGGAAMMAQPGSAGSNMLGGMGNWMTGLLGGGSMAGIGGLGNTAWGMPALEGAGSLSAGEIAALAAAA